MIRGVNVKSLYKRFLRTLRVFRECVRVTFSQGVGRYMGEGGALWMPDVETSGNVGVV